MTPLSATLPPPPAVKKVARERLDPTEDGTTPRVSDVLRLGRVPEESAGELGPARADIV